MNKKIHIISMAILIVVVAGVAFYGGIIYNKSTVKSFNGQNFGAGRTGNRSGSLAGTGFINGEVISKDATSITVKDRSGSSRIVFYSGTTEVGKFVSGNVSDVAVGQSIMANGKTNSDGSITAQSIQIRPAAPAGIAPQGGSGNGQ